MGVHWFDSFEPSDWIALVAAIVSLVAIAVPTALFFFERRERIAAEAATAVAEAARAAADSRVVEAEQQHARQLLELQRNEYQHLLDQEAARQAQLEREQAEQVFVWAAVHAGEVKVLMLNASQRPVFDVRVSMVAFLIDTEETQGLEALLGRGQFPKYFDFSIRQILPTGNKPLMHPLRKYSSAFHLHPPRFAPEDAEVEKIRFLDAAGVHWLLQSGTLSKY